jgi:hypothetical protein
MRFEFRGRNLAVALACLVAAGCTAGAQTPQTPPADAVTLSISFPADIKINRILPAGAEQTVPVTAQLALTNTSASAVTLQRPNDCQSHVWTVSDASGSTIDDRAICPMIFIPVRLSIAAHGTFTGTETVTLTGTKYRDGGHYTLHYTFWGAKADAAFTAHVVQ